MSWQSYAAKHSLPGVWAKTDAVQAVTGILAYLLGLPVKPVWYSGDYLRQCSMRVYCAPGFDDTSQLSTGFCVPAQQYSQVIVFARVAQCIPERFQSLNLTCYVWLQQMHD